MPTQNTIKSKSSMVFMGIITSIVILTMTLYNQVNVLPYAYDTTLPLSIREHFLNTKFVLGSLSLFLGGAVIIYGTIVLLKQFKNAWLILLLGCVIFFLGMIQSTHLFD